MSERLSDFQFTLLIAAVVATGATHIRHLPLWVSLPMLALIAWRALRRPRDGARVGAWIRVPLLLLLLLLIVRTYGNVLGREPGSVLGCGLLALKLLETDTIRDARVTLGFASFVLMAALLFAQELAFTLSVCAVLVLQLAALVALQPAPLAPSSPLRAPLRLAVLLLGVGMPLAAAAFVLLPRLASPLWGSTSGEIVGRTGLSERMAPGDLNELLIDDSPAFRVDFTGAPPPANQRYFRTIVLWNFDGVGWERGFILGGNIPIEPGGASTAAAIDYTITLEPTDRRWLPALDMPIQSPSEARMAFDHTLLANTLITQPRQYRAQSVLDMRLAPQELDAHEHWRALRLPPGFDPRARALAQQWRDAGGDDAAIVRKALDLFHASFTYSLTPPELGRDSIDDFLFDTRSGFCEHYSSAFVFLMRAAGIPARVITGYQGGWWNDSSHYLLVRQSDAHAWAEVWLAGEGWRRVDPTAAVDPARVELGAAVANGDPGGWEQSGWLRALRNHLDIVNRLWTGSIIRFDALRQRNLLTPFGLGESDPGELLFVLAAILSLVMIVAAIWAMANGARARGDALDAAWARLAAKLARGGIAMLPAEGPLDLGRRVQRLAPALAAAVHPLVDDYVHLRYGIAAPPAARVAAFARAVRQLRVRRHVRHRMET